MDTYSRYRPTVFDPSGLGLDDRQAWLVLPVGQNRDSGTLARSNFMTALDMLGGESDTCEVHRFNHWAVGWLEIIIVEPSMESRAQDIQNSLDNYPILNEEHHSQLEYEAACEYWESMRVKDRLEYCQRYKVSIFAARRDSIPEGIEISVLAE